MTVPYTFATATTSIPLSQLDSNFATAITLGNTAVYLGNTTTSIGNLTLTNATINGTVGATTPSTGAFTTLNSTGASNFATSSGNVGIGTSSPSYKLHVSSAQGASAIQSTTTTNSAYNAFINGGGTSYVGVDSSTGSVFSSGAYGFTIFNAANSATTFATNSVERMRIDSIGNLLVGTTSAAGVGLTIGNQAGNSGVPYLQFNKSLSGNVTVQYFYYNGSGVGTINISDTATSYNTSSDYRLKENVAPMQNALATVAALKPVTYTWKADGSKGQGFIAHELQAVVPDAVTGEKDAVDKDGKPQYQGVDTSFLVATLTAAIQEQQALITQLQADVAALKGN